jgi:hypothetical protein
MSLYELTGRFADAERLADSLFRSPAFGVTPFNHWLDRTRTYVAAVFVRTRNWDRLAEFSQRLGTGPQSCDAIDRELTGYALDVPALQLHRLMDTVAKHFVAVATNPVLSPCAEGLARYLTFAEPPAPRRAATAWFMSAWDSLHRAGRDQEAYLAGRLAARLDTMQLPALLQAEWFEKLARQIEIGASFDGGRFVVQGDSAVVTFPAVRNDPVWIGDSRGASLPLLIASTYTTDEASEFWITARHRGPPGPGRLASLPGLVGWLDSTVVGMRLPKPTQSRPVSGSVTFSSTSEGIRAVARGPAVAELIRLRTDSVWLRFSPCAIMRTGLCRVTRLRIEYH